MIHSNCLLAQPCARVAALRSPVLATARPQNVSLGQRAMATSVSKTKIMLQSQISTLRCYAASGESEFDVDDTLPVDAPSSLGPRDDDVLPANLADAVTASAAATAEAIQRSNNLCQVEIHLPEFWDPISGPNFPNRGDQDRFWRMTRRFTEELGIKLKTTNIKVVYPDAGVAAMLAYQWKDEVSFSFASLTDRRPVQATDEVIMVACPDPQGAEECIRMVQQIAEQDEKEGRAEGRPVILFNPRLSSGDVGLGLNARRMRTNFSNNFVVTYSLRPIGDVGSVFRSYPGMWKVFLEEEQNPGRYKLVAEKPSRPAGDALDYLLQQAEAAGGEMGADGNPVQRDIGFLGQLSATMSSVQKFMRSLSN